VRLVRETGRPITQVARDRGISEGTLGSRVNADRRRRDGGEGQLSEDEGAELVRLRRENAELTMEGDVARDQFGALLLSNELVFSPGHGRDPGRLVSACPLDCTSCERCCQAGHSYQAHPPQGVADADDEGDVVEEGEGNSEGLGEFDGLAGVAAGLRGDVPVLVRGAWACAELLPAGWVAWACAA
jgi:transposase